MMTETANHILSKEGILTTFSIAKRISKKNLTQLRQKIKNNKSDAKKFQELLKKTIFEETREALIAKKIPGIIIPGQNIPDEEKKLMMELAYFSSVISKKLAEKNLTKYYLCYVINCIVNMLNLDEKSFEDFHKKFRKSIDGDEENNSID